MSVDIRGLDKAKLLAALFNRSHQQGFGLRDLSGAAPMTAAEAQQILEERGERLYFDYLKGRVLKVDLGQDFTRDDLYDRDVGPGAFAAVVEELRQSP